MANQPIDAELEAELEIMRGWCCPENSKILIPNKCWVVGCREVQQFSGEPYYRPGPGLNTFCPSPIPKGTLFKATFSATSKGQFDYYIHHGPEEGLKLVSQTARCKFDTPWVEPPSPPETWHTVLTVAFFETTREVLGDYWCWFDPCYRIAVDQKPVPIRDAVLVVQVVHQPGVS